MRKVLKIEDLLTGEEYALESKENIQSNISFKDIEENQCVLFLVEKEYANWMFGKVETTYYDYYMDKNPIFPSVAIAVLDFIDKDIYNIKKIIFDMLNDCYDDTIFVSDIRIRQTINVAKSLIKQDMIDEDDFA